MRVTVELWGGPHDGAELVRDVVLVKDGGKGLPRWLEYRGRPDAAPAPKIRYELRAGEHQRVGSAIAAGDGACRVRYDVARPA